MGGLTFEVLAVLIAHCKVDQPIACPPPFSAPPFACLPACLLHMPSHLFIPSPFACWPAGPAFSVEQRPFDPDGWVPPPPRARPALPSARPSARPSSPLSADPLVRVPVCPSVHPSECPFACLQLPARLHAWLHTCRMPFDLDGDRPTPRSASDSG